MSSQCYHENRVYGTRNTILGPKNLKNQVLAEHGRFLLRLIPKWGYFGMAHPIRALVCANSVKLCAKSVFSAFSRFFQVWGWPVPAPKPENHGNGPPPCTQAPTIGVLVQRRGNRYRRIDWRGFRTANCEIQRRSRRITGFGPKLARKSGNSRRDW